MNFCPKCGKKIQQGAYFCCGCGANLASFENSSADVAHPVSQVSAANATPTPQSQYQGMPSYPQVPQQQVKSFPGVGVRYRCPNGHVFDGTQEQEVCPTCGMPLEKGGYIQIYRMGNYMGCAVGMGVYIDGIAYGMIANKQSIRISLPYGPHKVHITHTTTRKCNDPVFNLTPQSPNVWCKAHFSKAGFAINVDQASPESMPEA